MSISSQSQREEAYRARFGTAHPSRAQVLAWAKDIFPEMTMLRLKTVDGRTALMNNRDVLGVGADPVEAVASADIAKKQASVKAAASNQNTTPATIKPIMSPTNDKPFTPSESKDTAPSDVSADAPDKLVPFPQEPRLCTIEDIRASVARINCAMGAVNAAMLKAPLTHDSPEMKELNLSVILHNQLVGTPLKHLPVPDLPEPVNPKPNLATSDPKELAQQLA